MELIWIVVGIGAWLGTGWYGSLLGKRELLRLSPDVGWCSSDERFIRIVAIAGPLNLMVVLIWRAAVGKLGKV